MGIADWYLKTLYRLWAKLYEPLLEKIFSFDRKKVVSCVPPGKVLELAVGVGLDLPYFTKHHKVTGIDFSDAMLKQAADRAQNHVLVRADARDLPFRDNSFDHGLATFFLRVVPDPHLVLEEASRVIKQGGTLTVADHFTDTHDYLAWLTIPLGWGKDRKLLRVIQGSSWELVSDTQLGKSSMTRLVVLRNTK